MINDKWERPPLQAPAQKNNKPPRLHDTFGAWRDGRVQRNHGGGAQPIGAFKITISIVKHYKRLVFHGGKAGLHIAMQRVQRGYRSRAFA